MEKWEYLNQLCQDIQKKPTKKWSAEFVARGWGYTPWHFMRMFRAFTGYGFAEFVRNERMLFAAHELLRSGGGSALSLVDLALDCGFSSQESFTKAFQGYFGLPPGRFRKEGTLEHIEQCRAGKIPIDATSLSQVEQNLVHCPAGGFVGFVHTFTAASFEGDSPELQRLWKSFEDRVQSEGWSQGKIRVGATFLPPDGHPARDRGELFYAASIWLGDAALITPRDLFRFDTEPMKCVQLEFKTQMSEMSENIRAARNSWSLSTQYAFGRGPELEWYGNDPWDPSPAAERRVKLLFPVISRTEIP